MATVLLGPEVKSFVPSDSVDAVIINLAPQNPSLLQRARDVGEITVGVALESASVLRHNIATFKIEIPTPVVDRCAKFITERFSWLL